MRINNIRSLLSFLLIKEWICEADESYSQYRINRFIILKTFLILLFIQGKRVGIGACSCGWVLIACYGKEYHLDVMIKEDGYDFLCVKLEPDLATGITVIESVVNEKYNLFKIVSLFRKNYKMYIK